MSGDHSARSSLKIKWRCSLQQHREQIGVGEVAAKRAIPTITDS